MKDDTDDLRPATDSPDAADDLGLEPDDSLEPDDFDDDVDEDDLEDDEPDEADDLEADDLEDDEFDDDDLDDGLDEDDTDFATIATATTIEEAKRKALDQLRKVVPSIAAADVEYLVVDEGSKGGFFGRGKSQARVEARLRPGGERAESEAAELPEGAATLREFVQTAVDLMGIEARVSASETPESVRADIAGDDLGLLIGRHGATIDALQYIAAIVVNGDRRDRRQVVVDAEGYRDRRAAALTSLADRTAQKVAREGEAITLKPMTAAERKVIHLHLKDHPRVETVSEGNEPFRAVVVSPRRPD